MFLKIRQLIIPEMIKLTNELHLQDVKVQPQKPPEGSQVISSKRHIFIIYFYVWSLFWAHPKTEDLKLINEISFQHVNESEQY